jgi:hypothetical protein
LRSEEERYAYAQRLLGRLTFLYFLQRKGWLDGDRAYIRKQTSHLDGAHLFNFFYDLFEILNTEGTHTKTKGEIPYLNGSLFEREPYSKAQMSKISDACSPLLRYILRTLDQYNFTISESTLLDKEVAVDPELLGSLFESMLPESERGDKGVFYTHQDEMLFMSREVLRVYLDRCRDLTNDQVYHLAYGLDLPQESKFEPKIAREIKDKVREIRILDPAVGSGGFLMAALQVLLEVRGRLNKIIGTVEPDYDSKLEIIQKNIFGVDIEGEAIELARLRLWLTLVVDESLENIRPLPNLDYNLHQGDSLRVSEFDKTRQTKISMDMTVRAALTNQIATTREEYARAHGKDKELKKRNLDSALRKLVELETGAKLPKVVPFSYRAFFADVMANGGFDAILMNPPYITQEEIGRLPGQNPAHYKSEIVDDIKLLTSNKFQPNKQSDISVYFHVRSLTLLREGGVAVVIATGKWLDVKYGVPLQQYFLQHSTIECIYDSVDRSFSAEVNTVITVIRKPSNPLDSTGQNSVRFVYFKTAYRQVTGDIVREVRSYSQPGTYMKDKYRATIRSQHQLSQDGLTVVESADDDEDGEASPRRIKGKQPSEPSAVYVGSKWGNLHLRAPAVYYEILAKGGTRLKPLGGLYGLARGATSGCIDFFVLRKVQAPYREENLIRCENGFGRQFYFEERFCPPVLIEPEDISSFTLKRDALSLRIFRCAEEKSNLKGTHALEYIEWAEKSTDAKVTIIQGQDKGKKVRIPELATVASHEPWYNVPEVPPSRILVPRRVKNRQVVPLCEVPLYCSDRFYAVYSDKTEDLWLYFNSALFRLFLELNGRTEGAGALSIMVYEYKQCPAIDPLPSLSKKFLKLQQFRNRVAYRLVNIAEQGPLEFDQEDRRYLDDLVLQEIGFENPKERARVLQDVYAWLKARVLERLTKPKTAPESAAVSEKKRKQADLREFQ